jgi:hypothetical protein
MPCGCKQAKLKAAAEAKAAEEAAKIAEANGKS